jgi:hypothetical protein
MREVYCVGYTILSAGVSEKNSVWDIILGLPERERNAVCGIYN